MKIWLTGGVKSKQDKERWSQSDYLSTYISPQCGLFQFQGRCTFNGVFAAVGGRKV